MLPGWFERATEGSETGALARSVDWAATPLGDPSTWPGPLRGAVELCLATSFPMLVTWGPELTKIYNDGYRPMLGTDKHPAAMGASTQRVWSEIWDVVGPMFEKVITQGRSTWTTDQRLVIVRSGYPEECYFTYSYSPLRDEEGTVRGVLDVVTETTEQVLDRRRMALLATLNSALGPNTVDVAGVGRTVAEVFGRGHPDVPFVDLHVRMGADALLLATTRAAVATSVGGAPIRQAMSGRHAVQVDDALIFPLLLAGEREPVGVLVAGTNPLRAVDSAYRSFLDLLASSVANAMGAALRLSRQLGELRTISEVLQLSVLSGLSDSQDAAARYRPATGNLVVGGDWFDLVDLPGGRLAVVVGDCVGHGLDAAALMGQLRSASRALLLENNGAAATLDGLQRFAASLPGAQCTTVCCVVVDPAQGTLTYATAGHPPPLLLSVEGAAWLDQAIGLPLDVVEDDAYQEVEVPFAVGDTVLLYTDGLVERREESLSVGLRRLEATMLELGRCGDLSTTADRLLARMVPDGTQDDVALVLYRRPGPDVPVAYPAS